MIYSMSRKYLGKKNAAVIERNGAFAWNKEGGIITLKAVGNAPSQYLVGENKLIQLDMKGNRKTAGVAEKYKLQKK